MKLLVQTNQENLGTYIVHGADGFLLPLAHFSADYDGSYSLDAILNLRKQYPKTRLFVVMNEMLLNRDLKEVEAILKTLDVHQIDGILFYDWAIYRLHQKNHCQVPLFFHQTHMLTNRMSVEFLKEKGITGGVLANEITLSEVEAITKTSFQFFQLLIGYPPAGYSRRKLLSNFYSLGKEKKKDLLVHEDSTEMPFFLHETEKGTSLLYGKRLNATYFYEALEQCNITYGIIKQEDLEEKTVLQILDIYKKEKENAIRTEKIGNVLGRNTGFFARKTVFKVKK